MKKHWMGYAACLVLGLGMGLVLRGGVDSSAERGGEADSSSASHASGSSVQRPRSAVDGWKSGFSGYDGNVEVVSIPTALIHKVSNYPGVQSPRNALFREDDPVEELLKIQAHEKQSLINAWDTVRAKVEQLEVRSTRSKEHKDGTVTIEIPDLTQSLSPLGNDFQLAVEETLGSERGRVFLALKKVADAFSPDSGPRNYHLAVEAVGDGRWRYHITSEDSQSNRKVWVGESVPNEIRHITDAARILPSLTTANEGAPE